MDFSRNYPGSAFTEYYTGATSATLYPQTVYGEYNTTPTATNTRTTSFNYSNVIMTSSHGPAASVATAAGCTDRMYNTKPVNSDVLAQSPWSAFTSTWDMKVGNLQAHGTASQRHHSSRNSTSITGSCGSTTPKRKRKTTPAQRVAANVRERRRMCSLNTSFDKLRKRVPAFPHEKRLSRIQTLRLAMFYIAFMTEMLTGQDIYSLMKQQQQRQSLLQQQQQQSQAATQQQIEESKAAAMMWQPAFEQPCGGAQLLLVDNTFLGGSLGII